MPRPLRAIAEGARRRAGVALMAEAGMVARPVADLAEVLVAAIHGSCASSNMSMIYWSTKYA